MAQGARIANPDGKSSINVLSLGPDIWHLIADKLQLDTREDLYNLCLVSKAVYSLATLRLHRSVILADFARLDPDPSKRKHPWTSIQFLLCRLLDPTNESLRNAVREVEVGERLKPRYIGSIAGLTESNFLPSLVIALPNLKHFKYEMSLVHMELRLVLIENRAE
ncbi:hypothetical protein N7510_009957 [Penicillium lagena]|uniref:uncharacterized protein n=1 Tax=Penicillium lagena TaxID=94218 RepID=UPI0025408738|nr:uncharacterized protein N7510_009957 [Penicillium lagena]KAJ5604803.1 hypothetical protein N7510_009957 [Penicillium lagena]